MDYTAGNIGGYFGFALTGIGIIIAAVNHKRLRSNCCGKKIDISIDVEPTTENPHHQVNGAAHQSDPVRGQEDRSKADEVKVSVA